MKLMHLSDLHIGKRVGGFSMTEDQRYILDQILEIAESEQPDAILIAGDVYDKSVPSAEAVSIFDEFLVKLSVRKMQVFIISGNHDSPERLAIGSRLMGESGIHLAPVYDGDIRPHHLRDEHGELDIFLLPFIKPVDVRRFFPDEADDIVSYTDALRVAVAHMDTDDAKRSVLVTHQFVTGAERSESEDISVGGTDNVDASVFDPFDYVALGHIHHGQPVTASLPMRYSGAPLMLSFNHQHYRHRIIELVFDGAGGLSVEELPVPQRRMFLTLEGTLPDVRTMMAEVGRRHDAPYVRVRLAEPLTEPVSEQLEAAAREAGVVLCVTESAAV